VADDDKGVSDEDEEFDPLPSRSENLAKKKKIKDHLLKEYEKISKGYDNQWQRSDDTQDYWDIYNCRLGVKQFYTGNTDIFVPIVKNAIRARKTRFANQIFPPTGRYVECISSDGTEPNAITALAEHYVRKSRLRRKVPALLVNGDVEGQYTVYVSWSDRSRFVVTKEEASVEDEQDADVGEKVPDMSPEQELKSSHPTVEVIADADLLILPFTADSLLDAIHDGGSVTILRRWAKGKIKNLIKQKQIDEKLGEELIEEMSTDSPMRTDKEKGMARAAGIKEGARGKHVLVYETWSIIDTPDGKRLCRTFFGGKDKVLSCVRNPLWCDRLPIVSCPVEEIQGSAKGRSLIADIDTMQYYANDVVNEAADSSMYALLPIILTDPEKNPRIGSMVLNLAAVWQTSPNDTQFAKFPEMWKDAFEIISNVKAEIFQTLSVNPSMITQTAAAPKAKPSQAQVAQEQQVDMLSTADAVTTLEGGILSEVVTLFMEMDHQYRDEEISVRAYGDLGIRANMESVPELQMGNRYRFQWFGVEQARAMQMIQSQIGFVNVLKGIPPQAMPGYRVNLAPLLVHAASNIFGPRLAPMVIEDIKSQLDIDPKVEVELAEQGIETPVHPNDNHPEHMKALMEAFQKSGGDKTGVIRAQIVKRQVMLMQQQLQQLAPPGGGGGGQKGGGPRQGAKPAQQRAAQGPPGQINQDQLSQSDPSAMPRKF
jgi:hypothetical protein